VTSCEAGFSREGIFQIKEMWRMYPPFPG